VLIVDEIYQGLSYGVRCQHGPSRLGDDVFVVNSFSKYFGMTGWRLGWMVAPEAYVRDIEKLAQHFFIAPSTPAQHAALAAFRPDTIEILDARGCRSRGNAWPGLRQQRTRVTHAFCLHRCSRKNSRGIGQDGETAGLAEPNIPGIPAPGPKAGKGWDGGKRKRVPEGHAFAFHRTPHPIPEDWMRNPATVRDGNRWGTARQQPGSATT
jgi:hypothetical protein